MSLDAEPHTDPIHPKQSHVCSLTVATIHCKGKTVYPKHVQASKLSLLKLHTTQIVPVPGGRGHVGAKGIGHKGVKVLRFRGFSLHLQL